MVMEKSWNMKKWTKVMEFCYQSWNFSNFDPKMHQICMFFVTTKKLSIIVESLHFPPNAKLRREMVMENWQMVMEKSWKICCQVCGNRTPIPPHLGHTKKSVSCPARDSGGLIFFPNSFFPSIEMIWKILRERKKRKDLGKKFFWLTGNK